MILPVRTVIPVFRLHLHPFEGHGVLVAELASHDYAVDRPGAPAHHLLTAALHSFSVSERSARRDGPSSPTSTFPLGDLWVCVDGLDEPPGVGLLHGRTTRGDPELAVDGFDLGPYGARGDVEALRHLPGGELAAEQAKHIALALGQLPVELPLPRLARAKLPFLALEELGEDAGVGIASRMARASASTVLAPARSPRAARTGASASNPMRVGQGLKPGKLRRAESALQLLQLPASCERTSERDGRQIVWGSLAAETCRPALWPRARATRLPPGAPHPWQRTTGK